MTIKRIEKLEDYFMKVEELQKGLIMKEVTPEEASDFMVHELRDRMLYFINGTRNYSDASKQEIFLLLYICQYLYNYGGLDTGLTDPEYDMLYEIYESFGYEDLVTVPLPSDKKNVDHHTYISLRGTLEKIYYLNEGESAQNKSREGLPDWIKAKEKMIKEKSDKDVDLSEEEVFVFPKWDGVSCIFEFNPDGSLSKALTRGYTRTNECQNITKSFPNMRGNETMYGYGLKTEILMRESDLKYYNDKYNSKYKNTRSIVASILNSCTNDERNSLLVIEKLRQSVIKDGVESFQTLDEMALEDNYIKCKLKETDKISEFAEKHRFVDGLRCDGAVIYLKNKKLQEILGRDYEKNRNNYEVAYKFTEEVSLSNVRDVIFQLGPTGALAPIAKIEPVVLKGNTIKRVSLGSMDRFNELKLRKGDTVKILYDIIPYLVFDLDCKHDKKNKVIKAPTECPYCGEKLDTNDDGVPIRCSNNKCVWRKKGKIFNFCDKVRIDGVGWNIVDKLYDAGIWKTILDVYRIDKQRDAICMLNSFSDMSYQNLRASIEAKRDLDECEFLGALGIPGVSNKTFEVILNAMTLKRLMVCCNYDDIDELCKLPGIKEKKASKVIEGIKENTKLIDKFITTGLIKLHHNIPDKSKFKVCFTKFRDSQMEDFVKNNGGEVVDDVTKDTTYLVVPDINTESGKVKKAIKYGVEIIPKDRLEEVITNINT